jgi:hypothetical protein
LVNGSLVRPSCDEGLFECNLMPFGLKSAGNTFVRALSTIMKQVEPFTEPFVDDISLVVATLKPLGLDW